MNQARLLIFLMVLAVFLSACGVNKNVPEAEPLYNQNGASLSYLSSVSEEELSKISERLYQNVTDGNANHIVQWNNKQQSLHLGFGFVWYPQMSDNGSKSTFPSYLRYLQNQQVPLPIWLMNAVQTGAPWSTRASFERSKNDSEMRELRRILQTTKELQALFLLDRLQKNTPRIVQQASARERERLIYNLQAMRKAKGGLYPLLDYVSFNESALPRVLSHMQKHTSHERVLEAFAESAKHHAGFGLLDDGVSGKSVEERVKSYATPVY